MARHLSHVKRERPYAKLARYGGVYGRDDKRILSRVRTYKRLASPAPKLADEVRALLGLGLGEAADARK